MDLWTKLSQNEALNTLDRELVKCWPKEAEKNFRQGFYICSEMIQLMENVFLDLRLDETWEHPDNAGWRATFEQWSASQTMENTWALTSENYGLRFRHFCERRLKLPFSSKAAIVSGR